MKVLAETSFPFFIEQLINWMNSSPLPPNSKRKRCLFALFVLSISKWEVRGSFFDFNSTQCGCIYTDYDFEVGS
jgi:hypothetical protein